MNGFGLGRSRLGPETYSWPNAFFSMLKALTYKVDIIIIVAGEGKQSKTPLPNPAPRGITNS